VPGRPRAAPAPCCSATGTGTAAGLQEPGAVGIGAYRPGSATAATTVRFDDLQVTVAP
jgi:hypothetical protein